MADQRARSCARIVENWRTDPRLTALWLEQMQTFTDATVARSTADPAARSGLAGQDVPAVASALTWLGERLYYLAAIGSPPFDDQDTLVETLLFLWTSALSTAGTRRPMTTPVAGHGATVASRWPASLSHLVLSFVGQSVMPGWTR